MLKLTDAQRRIVQRALRTTTGTCTTSDRSAATQLHDMGLVLLHALSATRTKVQLTAKAQRALAKEQAAQSLAEGQVQFTSATQYLLHQAVASAADVQHAAELLQRAVFLEEIEDALAALIRAGKQAADRAVLARDAVAMEAADPEAP